jgi:hypothetical protein
MYRKHIKYKLIKTVPDVINYIIYGNTLLDVLNDVSCKRTSHLNLIGINSGHCSGARLVIENIQRE